MKEEDLPVVRPIRTVKSVIENIIGYQPDIDLKRLNGYHTLSEPTDDNGRVCIEFLRW
ncbi:hypothetical protein TOTORO_00860 [Serratia phage vB_SmaS-Totoro]|nr:hypothetical protein TOTORO_00860 [Serratia phage vB_SmaS-Totoro]